MGVSVWIVVIAVIGLMKLEAQAFVVTSSFVRTNNRSVEASHQSKRCVLIHSPQSHCQKYWMAMKAKESKQQSDVPTYKIDRVHKSSTIYPSSRRRDWINQIVTQTIVCSGVFSAAFKSNAAESDEFTGSKNENDSNISPKVFRSGAFPLREYTNSLVASSDTNISPAEVYDSIASKFLEEPLSIPGSNPKRALDVGAGAGVSTQILWDMGYRKIDAIDWSGAAWDRYVVQGGQCPSQVHFFEMDDERYFQQLTSSSKDAEKMDAIVFNFAVNESKARQFASKFLVPETGRLLAPINTQRDYWLKQTYVVMNSNCDILWSTSDVGAWSVQFQPDVTQDTCQGVWCAPYNGFQKLKK
jgi:hypothetical protein